MNSARADRIRIGVLAFPISGLVAVSTALAPGIDINPAVDPAGFAQAAGSVGLANLIGIVSLIFLLFGFQALQAFLEKNSVNKFAFMGLIASTVGVGLFLPFLGIIALAGPVAGRFFLNGQVQSVSVISEAIGISNPVALAFGGVSVLSSVLGSSFFSVAIWRSGMLPKWSAVAYVISSPLSWTPHYIPVIWFLGGMLLFGAGIGITNGIWNALSQEHWARV